MTLKNATLLAIISTLFFLTFSILNIIGFVWSEENLWVARLFNAIANFLLLLFFIIFFKKQK